MPLTGSCYAVVTELVKRGIDINSMDNAGCSALHHACISYASEDEESKKAHEKMECLADLMREVWYSQFSSMVQAAYEIIVEALTALLDAGADVNLRNVAGKMVLDLLASQPYARNAFTLLRSRGAVFGIGGSLPWWAVE